MTRVLQFANKVSIHAENFRQEGARGFTVLLFGKAITVAFYQKWLGFSAMKCQSKGETFARYVVLGCLIVYVSF